MWTDITYIHVLEPNETCWICNDFVRFLFDENSSIDFEFVRFFLKLLNFIEFCI